MKKWILALAMVLSAIPAARAAVPGHRNTNIVCEDYYNIWVVTAERTGNPKYDGTVLRLDVKENKDSVLTVKYGTNFWGGWVREGDKLEFSGKWQGNKLSWNIVPGGSPNRYMLQVDGKTAKFITGVPGQEGSSTWQCNVLLSEWAPPRQGSP
jgi:hypothetical protein